MTTQRSSLWFAVIAALVSVAACQDSPSPASVAKSTAPLTITSPPAPVSFNLVYPSGYGLSQVPVGASQGVLLGPGDKVLAINGSPGTVTNAGSGLVTVGSGSSTGAIVSTGNVLLLPLGVTATSAQSSGTVIVGLGDNVPTVTQHATLTPLAQRTITLPTMTGTPAEVLAGPGATTLAPGLYDNVNILPGAVVTLSAGNYVVNNFILSPLSQLNLNTSGGAINVYVNNTALWNGEVTGDGTQFLFAYLGILPFTVAGPFTGTALAPNAILNLGPLPASYSGNFYGQQIVMAPGVTVQQIATPLLIDGLTVSNTTLCVGQQTEVTFSAGSAGAGAQTWINGTPGTHQFVQFAGAAGPRTIFASVFTPDGRADFTSVPVTVQQCTYPAGTAPPVALHFWPTPTKVNDVELMVHDYNSGGFEVLPTGPATYAWTFGDGQTATTTSPLVEHDYTAAVNPMLPYNYFTAQVTVTSSSGTATTHKVVPILSVYAANRAKGVVQPPSALGVDSSGSNLVMTVTNYESTPLSITSSRIDLMPCDPSLDAVQQTPLAMSVTIPAASSMAVSVPQPTPFGTDICAVGTHLMGTAAAGTVYTDSYARIRENSLTQQAVTDPATIAILNTASTYSSDPNQFDEYLIRQLLAQGVITSLPASVPAGTTYANPIPAAGQPCTPGDNPEGQDLACQPTADWVVNPGELLNAFQGNFVVHHACGDMIADLLSSIGQTYSHSMTISKNHVEIRHSTASEDRMIGSVNFASESLDSSKLQYGFPGTYGLQAYSVDQMINGYCAPELDPSVTSGFTCSGGWQMSGNLHENPSQCSADLPVVYPLVVRPPPTATTAQAQVVDQVGVQAATDVTGHYRFFMYSHADEYAPATSGPAWANATEESVCSLFDLQSTRHANGSNGPLPLRPSYVAPVGVSVPDGMRYYSQATRTTAAQNLYSSVNNQVMSQADPAVQIAVAAGAQALLGPLAPVFDVAAEIYIHSLASSLSNQVVNCFASDGCGDTSGTWNNGVGTGIAVSPDDILAWDLPNPSGTGGGTYGYNEPLAYAPTSFRHAYQWVPVSGSASMTVSVVDQNGNPIEGANIYLDSWVNGTTNSAGQVQIPVVPQGIYDIEAQDYLTPPPSPTPPPAPPTLTPADILALPACSAAPLTGFSSPCSISGTNPSCQNSLSGGSTPANDAALWSQECIITKVTDVNKELTFESTCACFAPTTPPATCNLAIADTTRTVPATGNVMVELTLCTQSCTNGQPGTCTQRCLSDADCQNTQVCNSSNDCVAAPRLVTVSGPAFLTVTQNAIGFPTNTWDLSINVTCDPNGSQTAEWSQCETENGTSDEGVLDVQCQEDSTGGIGVTLTTSIYDDGCSENTLQSSGTSPVFALPPAGPSDPEPSITTTAFHACYKTDLEGEFGLTSSDCAYNNFGGSGFTITSVPK
jgi:hypothetical protein